MLDILAITSPIYIIIFLGYLFTRIGVFAKVEMRVFGKFVLNLALPALLFKTLAQRQLGEIINASYLLAYLLGSLLVIGVGFVWARRVNGLDTTASTFQAMGMACSNSGYVGYPILLLTLAAVATACGIVLTMSLFALIGPRRTRAVAQILAALVGAMMFILSQAYNLTRSHDDRPSAIMNGVKQLSESGAFSNHSLLTWPVQAITGGLIPLAVIGLIGIVVVSVVIQLLAPRFATNAAEAVGDRTQPNRLKGADRDFAQGLTRSMVRKELRLLSRDPQLISQVLLRILYLFPLGFVLFRNADNINGIALGAAGLVVMSGQLAGSFAWVALSAEDSPDLLQSAPINRAVADRAKLIAALTPTLFLSLLAIAGFAFLSPVAAIVVFVGCLCSASCSGLIQVWRQKPANRKAFNQRQRSSFLLSLAELIIQGGWGAATAMAVRGWIWAIIPAILAIGVTLLLRRAPDKRVTPV